ncbi:MarR family winged helix-turn-helix transcriptional regulator [Bradyrhizobium sp. RD5-C2]|uniref:MarR family winged helix-turn-helix transcriptional regulator n=1 Tax=Bradyrhizobium sp. RD5-C2 TaxID=244562 RepID=UPI001CC59DEA|nr:MarR family transcriptional regulator [Bradyrhizobium sp. RD5-C2]GIQ75019.1 MarR family transcriptional regulator [Bradyrhizobium sp. RD5-C2]
MNTRKPTDPPLPTRFSGPAESPGFLLWRVSNAWQRRQRAALQPLGLTHSQFVILACATWFGEKETLTQARIGELTGVDPMTTSQIVRSLESLKYLTRRTHPDDPRAKMIVVTSAGRTLAQRAVVVVEQTDAAFFRAVADDAGGLVKLLQVLATDE